jgi:poly-gamma-glutamate capsule biosynthesis protein CapA/YwtB (metallophosphatase superfamily)
MQDASRRGFLLTSVASAALAPARSADAIAAMFGHDPGASAVTLLLCGDVMLGRGIDQILRRPGDPQLHEPYVSSATTYVELAEAAHGPIPRAVDDAYVWGEALDTLRRIESTVRIINLETSITASEDFLPKGINYKMHPANGGVLTAAGIDCCVLANNHVLDWGHSGLRDTLTALEQLGIRFAGAGRDAAGAAAPAVLQAGGGVRVLVFGFGAASSGIPTAWAAGRDGPGVDLLPDLSRATVEAIGARAQAERRPNDLLVASIHWGGNWGYEIPPDQTAFAHGLIEQGFDVVHGHSSHHAKAIEIHEGRPVLYGCGDFLNDYEGITGKEEFRDDLAVMYLPAFAARRPELVAFPLEVFQIRRFRLQRASVDDTRWLQATLERESRRFRTRVEWRGANRLAVHW